jgi:hypothetical protein
VSQAVSERSSPFLRNASPAAWLSKRLLSFVYHVVKDGAMVRSLALLDNFIIDGLIVDRSSAT